MSRELTRETRDAMLKLNGQINPSFCRLCEQHMREDQQRACQSNACPFQARSSNDGTEAVEQR